MLCCLNLIAMRSNLSLLPLQPEEALSGLNAATQQLQVEGFNDDEALLKLEFEFDAWLDSTAPTLSHHFDPLLARASWYSSSLGTPSKTYSQLVTKLTSKFSMRRRQAVIILTQLPTIVMLANGNQMSCAGIARLLARMGRRGVLDWRVVDTIISHFGIHHELDEAAVSQLIESEKIQAEAVMGDSTVETLIEVLSEHAEEIGLEQRFTLGLRELFEPQQGNCFIPYLQTLLYLTVIDQFFDHPTEYLYTFRPRGRAANVVFEIFPSSLAPTGNPILNNFKAVDRLSEDWARSRHDQREIAVALVDVVEGLSSLAYLPRRQMSSLLRLALLKFIQIKTPATIVLNNVTTVDELVRFTALVVEAPTVTRGIVEQRLSDFCGALLHSTPKWRPRGLGDPVNATNRSSKKLGDCDFQDATGRRCIAMEAHAGRLTDVYIKEHLRTLKLNLPNRLEEWTTIADITEWRLELFFLVHEDGTTGNGKTINLPVAAELRIRSFRQYFNEVIKPQLAAHPQTTIDLFNRWVIAPLNSTNTPASVKTIAQGLLAHPT
jgi:hypothetical protein